MLLMIPGPIEVSPAVCESFCRPPPSHLSVDVIDAHARSLELMRAVWRADDSSQPFVVPGSGTIAMEMAVANLLDATDVALVVNTGYFSDRIAEMARRRGASVEEVTAEPGEVPTLDAIESAAKRQSPDVVFATHVDTSTGVKVEPRAICELAARHGALSVFDGVCATAAERFDMDDWGADVYLTASQKAIGLPVGLGMMVVSEAALLRRKDLRTPVPMALDWEQWLPIMQAYEDRRPSYFSTPASNLLCALPIALQEILADGVEARWALHERKAAVMREVWRRLGLELLCDPSHAANTLSAVRYPDGVGPELVAAIRDRGVVVAGGLYPGLQGSYFRVGHMGYSVTRPDHLRRTAEAARDALVSLGHDRDATFDDLEF